MRQISTASFIILIIMLFCVSGALSQSGYYINLKATGPGSAESADTVRTFGWDRNATYCKDSLLFGESELPPAPPTGVWDFRFIDPRGFNDACMGQGMNKDIRNWIPSVTIADTFQIELKLASAGSYTLTWDPITNTDIKSAFLQDLYGGVLVNVDMLTSTSKLVPGTLLTLYIITSTVNNVKAENELPTSFGLQQNYPNPFNPTTNLKFSIPEKSNVEISVFDMLGRKISTLVSENLAANVYSVEWNGRNDNGTSLASGVYNIRMVAVSELGKIFTDVRKVVLMK